MSSGQVKISGICPIWRVTWKSISDHKQTGNRTNPIFFHKHKKVGNVGNVDIIANFVLSYIEGFLLYFMLN